MNFTYKKKSGVIGEVYRWFMYRAVHNEYLDYIHVPSKGYVETISQEFNIPKSKVIVCPFGVIDRSSEFNSAENPEYLHIPEHYALAIGRSNRDYAFLVDAWSDIELPLVIVCDQPDVSEIPKGILWLDSVSGRTQYPLIKNCELLVLPLKDGSIPSGDTVVLTAMSFGKKIIVTEPSTIAEMYIVNGENGLTVEKDKLAMEKAVETALSNADLGVKARDCYKENYSLYAMGMRIGQKVSL